MAGFHAVLDGNEVDIHDYLSIFPKAAEERELLACALMRLRKQVELKIGCTIGPSLDEMLVVMGLFRCWDGGALRTFTRLSPPRSSSAHYLDAYRTVVRELWRNDPPTAAFAALSMLRQARVLVRDTTVDPGELEKCRVLVDALDASQSVGWLADRFEDLPLGPRPEPAEWWALSDRDKEHWRSRVLDRISRQDAAGIGLCEYILTWTGKMEYADLEPLVVAILDRDGDYSLLVDMSRPLAGAGSIRAGSLLSSLRSMPMAYDLRDVGGAPERNTLERSTAG